MLNVCKVDPKAFIAYLPKLKERADELSRSEEESLACEHLKFLIEFVNE